VSIPAQPDAGGHNAGAALLTVVGGYLGAGKTTLINRLLAGAGDRRVAVVVNDFGAVGVDASLIRSRTEDTIELTNGCLCCSLTDELADVMTALAAREPRFEHVVVELSGVGQVSAMTAWGWFPGFRPGRTVVCADALSGRARARDRWTGDVVLAQLRAADLVIVTKGDLAGEAAATEFEKWLATVAPGAAIVRGSPRLEAMVLLQEKSGGRAATAARPETADDTADATADATAGDADDDYVTWSATGRGVVRCQVLEAFLRALDPGIVRVKGIVRLAEAPSRRTVVQGVDGRWELTDGGPWTGADEPPRLVLIALRNRPPGRAGSRLPDAGREANQVLNGP
jgi:G3E family GTPase